jgi:hypothetical protein
MMCSKQVRFLHSQKMSETLLNKNLCLNNLEKKNINFEVDLSRFGVTKKEFCSSIVTLEMYPVDKIQALKSYYEHSLTECRMKGDLSSKKKMLNQYRIIESILNPGPEGFFYLENGFFIRAMHYGYTHGDNIGRIFSLDKSLQQFSRQNRFYLFKGVYKDLDISNAHPSILLDYAEKKKIETPSLRAFVKNRERFTTQVAAELEIKKNGVKVLVLICLNITHKDFMSEYRGYSKSAALTDLHKDVVVIREHLWQNPFADYSDSLSKKIFKKKNVDKQQVSVQSHYCLTIESVFLKKLYNFLLAQIKDDKPERSLHFVPFFDGAYVRYSNIMLQSKIEEYLGVFNEGNDNIKFKLKEIEDDLEKESRYADLDKFENITTFLKSLGFKRFNRLLATLGLDKYQVLTQETLKNVVKNSRAVSLQLKRLKEKKKAAVNLCKKLERKIKNPKTLTGITPDIEPIKKQLDLEKSLIADITVEMRKLYRYYLDKDESSSIKANAISFKYKLNCQLLTHAESVDSLENMLEKDKDL